ncbi:centromere protein U isoform X2 [Hemitrygon akajei]|uniref:centromere protein U isoform X2 n=1 Tax=Hemitrygon akajei TaxID=2704970 RepID=UPI003BF94326
MRKQKVASTSKRSNLQGSKAARAKKGGQNQTKHRQTPVNKNQDKSSSQKHPYFSPNLSSILKNSESQYDDLQNEYYDHPLHSTAVFSGDLELNDEGNEKRDEDLAWSNMHKEPTWHSAPQGGKIRKEKRLEVPAHISEGVEPEGSGKDTEVNNCEASSESTLKPVKKDTSVRNDDKTSGQIKENTLGRTSIGSDASPNSSALRPATPEDRPLSLKIWCPEGVKRLSKDVTELDVVLNDFEQIVTEFKQSVEPFTSRKVVNRFFINLKEQVTETINQVQDLKSLQRKNAKVTSSFSKTRKHFLIVQKELNEQEVELKRLRKERAELSQKKTDLQHAKQFLSGFKQLKTQYIEHRNKNPSETETYDISSFPALLAEARGILGAEKQLHLINTKIQQSLDKK